MNYVIASLVAGIVCFGGYVIWDIRLGPEKEPFDHPKLIDASATNSKLLGPHPRVTPSSVNEEKYLVSAEGQGLAVDKELIAAGKKSIEEGLAFIDRKYPPEMRQAAKKFLMLELAKRDLKMFSEVIRVLAPAERGDVLSSAIAHWVQEDVRGLLSYSETLPAGYLRNRIEAAAAVYLGEKNQLDDAMQVVNRMPFSASRTQAIGNIAGSFRGTAEEGVEWSLRFQLPEDVRAAQDMLVSNFRDKKNTNELRALATSPAVAEDLKHYIWNQLGRLTGELGASEFEKQLKTMRPEPRDQDLFILGAMSTTSDAELPTVLGYALGSQEVGTREAAARQYVSRLFATDQNGAAEWAAKAPPEIRTAAIETLVDRWYNNDSMALSEWIQRMPVGRERDTGLSKLANLLRTSDLDAARQIAGAISDSTQRAKLLREIK